MDFIIEHKWWFIIPIGIFVLLVIIGLFANEEESEDGKSVDEKKVKKRVDFLTGGKASKLMDMYDNDPEVQQSIKAHDKSLTELKDTIKKSKAVRSKLLAKYGLNKSNKSRDTELSKDPKTRLINNYGREVGEKLYNQELWRGMTKEMLSDSRGYPDKKNETVLKTKTKVHWFYKAYRTQQSKKFKIRIDLENNIVVRWEDLG